MLAFLVANHPNGLLLHKVCPRWGPAVLCRTRQINYEVKGFQIMAKLPKETPAPVRPSRPSARPPASPPANPPAHVDTGKSASPPAPAAGPPPVAGPEHRGFYADFFGFRERPFTLLPDPELLLWSQQYRRAFSVLEFGVMSRSPITLMTGAIGCGKTTLLRELLAHLDDTLTVGLISNAQGGRGALIQWVLNALGQSFDPNAGYVHLFQAMQNFMIAEYAAGRRTLLIFDEAQNLSQESLEELRMLTNINTGKDEVVQLVLIGQPELRDMIRQPNLEQLAQRIAVSFHLDPLDRDTTTAFIKHRLRAVGGSGEEFTEDAMAHVHEVTRGVPRLINQFCDMALLYAWTREQHQVTRVILGQVLADNIFFAAQAPIQTPAQTPAQTTVKAPVTPPAAPPAVDSPQTGAPLSGPASEGNPG
jgi:general secretion pathway protein A